MTDQPTPTLDAAPNDRTRLDLIAEVLKVDRSFFFVDANSRALRLPPDPKKIADFANSEPGRQLVRLLSQIEDPAIKQRAIELVLTVGTLKAASQ